MNTFRRRLGTDVPLMTMDVLVHLAGAGWTERDLQAAEHPYLKEMRSKMTPKVEMLGDVAIVPVQGALAYNPDPWEMVYGVEDSRSVLKMVNEAAGNAEASAILLRMDSPGGMLLGGPEIADAITAATKQKPVVAHIGGMGASLGYMIAAQANYVVANRSALVGSIGVIASVVDYTAMLESMGIKMEYFVNKEAKFKAAGAMGNPLTEDHREYFQDRVDSAFAMFKDMVLARRPQVGVETMRGQIFRGEEARQAGLVDAVGGENFALKMLQQMRPT